MPNSLLFMPHITGFVLDNNERPVENATVALPIAGLFALSGDNGFFEIADVPPGYQRFNVVHRRFQKFVADLRIIEDMEITINLDDQL
jgi:hypothetical protein